MKGPQIILSSFLSLFSLEVRTESAKAVSLANQQADESAKLKAPTSLQGKTSAQDHTQKHQKLQLLIGAFTLRAAGGPSTGITLSAASKLQLPDTKEPSFKVYVYELPAEYHSQLKKDQSRCISDQYGTEIRIHESLLESKYRTMNPE
eukprot:scaffold184069_cov45-Prasinocladus_malaysianus.AAC.1